VLGGLAVCAWQRRAFVKQCEQCGLFSGSFGVTIDANGLCNYCNHWKAQSQRLTNYSALGEFLDDRVQKLRGRGPYDALVGFSGGKDSTYAVHTLAQRFGLRVLAVTFDNGFLTDYARQSIASTINLLKIDQYFFSPNWDTHKAFYEASFRTYGDPCIACAMGIYFHSIKTAYEKGIPMVVHGRSPFQIFRNYYDGSPDNFLALHESNYEPHSFDRLAEIYGDLDHAARGWLDRMFENDPSMKERVYAEFFLNVESAEKTRLPDFIGLFQYLAYDEEQIKRSMEEELGYRRPEGDELLGHGDCSIHDASGYVFRQIHGASATDVEVAAMRRHGALSEEAAEALLAKKNAHDAEYPEASVGAFCRKFGWSKQEYDVRVESLRGRIHEKFPCH
jgi:hypothetical protein